jgi:hypothetical protein
MLSSGIGYRVVVSTDQKFIRHQGPVRGAQAEGIASTGCWSRRHRAVLTDVILFGYIGGRFTTAFLRAILRSDGSVTRLAHLRMADDLRQDRVGGAAAPAPFYAQAVFKGGGLAFMKLRQAMKAACLRQS